MHPNKRKILATASLFAAIILLGMMPAKGQILWGTATNISTDTDVSTTGTYFDAALTVPTSPAVTINNVLFNVIASGNVNAKDPSGDIQLTSSRNFPFVGGNSPSGSANYNTLVTNPEYAQNQAQTVQLNNLTLGDVYQVEVWSASIGKGAFLTALSGTNPVTLSANTGQYAIGTFTATGTSFSFTATNAANSVNNVDMLNAISVRDETVAAVPEPSASAFALALSGTFGLGSFLAYRRRHQKS